MHGIFQTSCSHLCLALFLSSVALVKSRAAEPTASASPAISEAARRIAQAADKFLVSLDDSGRKGAVYKFNDEEQRKRWSNLPTSFVKRGGLRMGDLTPAQREAAMALLATALSPKGYEKVVQIVEADEVLNQGSQRKMFGRDEYYISFLGTPSTTTPWMIQFGGHHLALNITLAGQKATLAPSHTAAQPAIYELEGKTIRPLGGETDKAHELMASLDESQRKQAVLGFEMRDLVLGPGRDGQVIQPEGLKGSELTPKQGELLLELATEWTGIMHEAVAKAKLEEMKKHLEETWFAWSGPTEKDSSAYFRIQGPTVLIEYAPQRLGGDTKKHIHTIYRDPTNEYGAKWTKEP